MGMASDQHGTIKLMHASTTENQGQLKFVFARKNLCLPRPKTVVIGKKSIWVTNKIKLQ
jgi:hypothetical protein